VLPSTGSAHNGDSLVAEGRRLIRTNRKLLLITDTTLSILIIVVNNKNSMCP